MKNFRLISCWLTSLAAAVIAPPAFGQEKPDTSSWICEYCPFESGHRGQYEAGSSYVSDDSARYGDARGYDDRGAYIDLAGEGAYQSAGYQAEWRIDDLGLDSRHLFISGGKQGVFGLHADYRELPQHVFDTTRSVFVESADNELSLPPSWARAPVTSGFTALDDSLADRDIGSERRQLQVGGHYRLTDGLRVTASYRRQERDGLRIVGGSYYTQASLLPAPFEFSTDEADLAIRYATDSGYLKLGYFGSFFQNENLALRWQTPFTSASGAETGALSQAPDNSFHQLTLGGGYRLAGYDTVLRFSAAAGRMEQHDTLLPYDNNPLLDTGPLPRERLDGQVDTTNLALTLSGRPLARASLQFAFRLDDRDNRTSIDQWNRTIVDTFNSGESEVNVPYSFRKTSIKASGRYDLFDDLDVAAGIERIEHDRDFQEVAEQTEDSGWGMLRWRPGNLVDVRAKGGVSERDVDRYDEDVAISLGQNPLMRKYNLAYRYRRFAELKIAASLPSPALALTLTSLYAEDEYSRSRLGLTDADDLRLAGDFSWTIDENRHVYLHAGYESIESQQQGSEQFATSDWSARNVDSFRSAGGGFLWRLLDDAVDLTLDYTRALGETEISLRSSAQGASRFPDLESTLDSLRLGITWNRSERLALRAGLHYESFAVDDWALAGVGPATVPVLLTLGAAEYDYDVTRVMLGFIYRPGRTTGPSAGDETP